MTKWIIRILLTLIVMTAILFGGLSLLAGTGEPQKLGLEDAFGKALNATVNFDSLESFNIFPQFTIRVKGFNAIYQGDKGDIHGEDMTISFDLIDLILKKRSINQFNISNMTIDRGTWFDQPVEIKSSNIGILEGDSSPSLLIAGNYGTQPLKITISMEQIPNRFPPAYLFATENSLLIEIGTTSITGKFSPNASDNTALHDLKISRNDKLCTTLPTTNRFTMQSFTEKIFSKIIKSDTDQTDLDELCSEIMRYGL
ncbi:MAG: hypothetical protein KDJ26_01270 [Alphaproteobacteria bacterium]|jgi:hypothetical protein|nr:hypothetical protein [Alphaproteobacteria bacterium]MCB1550609.1 hypothetical protein [Alphaproteobacteria bacterium]MCB9985474.1 hypothetical protein [Micavibrio sp.]HRK98706.1 hypothetical protein [Alphaproteobacteria bacterium]